MRLTLAFPKAVPGKDLYSELSGVGNTYPISAGLESTTLGAEVSQTASYLEVPDIEKVITPRQIPASSRRPPIRS